MKPESYIKTCSRHGNLEQSKLSQQQQYILMVHRPPYKTPQECGPHGEMRFKNRRGEEKNSSEGPPLGSSSETTTTKRSPSVLWGIVSDIVTCQARLHNHSPGFSSTRILSLHSLGLSFASFIFYQYLHKGGQCPFPFFFTLVNSIFFFSSP